MSPQPDFRFVKVGRWESGQALQHAIQSAGFREVSQALADFGGHPSLYQVVRT